MNAFRLLLRSNTVLMQVGDDYLIKDDVSRFGLHRRHVIREGGLPDVSWVETQKKTAEVSYWMYMDDKDIGHLWMTWKTV